MPNPIDSILAPIELSADNGVTYKVLICVVGWTVNLQTQTTTTDTQCGRIIGTGVIAFNPTVQAVCDQAPSNVQVSMLQCILWQTAKTSLKFRVQSPASASFSLGASYYLTGTCIITDTTITDQTNDPIKFSVTILGQGNVNTTIGT
jgi:hypothetical protein